MPVNGVLQVVISLTDDKTLVTRISIEYFLGILVTQFYQSPWINGKGYYVYFPELGIIAERIAAIETGVECLPQPIYL